MKKTFLFLILPLFFLSGSYLVYKRYFKAPDVTILGSVKMSDGLGRHPVELINAFSSDLEFSMIHTAKPCFIDVPRKTKKIIKSKYKKQGKVLLSFDSVWTPTYSCIRHLKEEDAPHQLRIAYSMFESTAIPPEWVTILNCYFDAVVVPDPFHQEIYESSGVQTPIFVLPLVLDLKPCLAKPLKEKPNTPFVFGNLSACVERKNQLLLIKAFHRAFGNRSDVLLKINSRYADSDYKQVIDDYIKEHGLTNVIVSTVCLDKHSYLNFFSSLDAYISISRGEGFSIQPREAMALGIPTLVTNNTAQTTIAKSHLTLSIETPEKIPAIYNWDKTKSYGEWSTCSEEEVATALLILYNNYDAQLEKSQNARAWARESDFSHLKPLYQTLLHPKAVELGTENKITPEKLITTSPSLLKKYQAL